MQNFFELFKLDVSYHIDRDKLENNYHKLQKAVHPDKFASSFTSQQQIANEYSAVLNRGFKVLSSPIQRAEHLLEIAGCRITEKNKIADKDFLQQQFVWNVEYNEIQEQYDSQRIKQLHLMLENQWSKLEQEFVDLYNTNRAPDAIATVLKMRLIHQLLLKTNT